MRPLFSRSFFVHSSSRPASSRLSALFSCLVLLLLAPLASAQTPPFYAGSTQTVYASGYNNGAGDGNGLQTWYVGGPSSGDSQGPTNGWQVKETASSTGSGIVYSFSITAPSTAPIGQYRVSYASKQTLYQGEPIYSGPYATFQIVAPPPALPAAGNPAFSWQGSVAGVNTGNGNKTTTVPITGWTMRGGMGVSCVLFHNSQGALYGAYGYKWLPSYYTYISGGVSAPVLHWDNGQVEAFQLVSTVNGNSTYNSPYGILDKLTCSSGLFTLTTPGQTAYTFGYSNGNAYLSSITDLDGNTLTIGHNSDATISTVSDPQGRTLTYTYAGGHLVQISDPLSRIFAEFYTGSDLTQVNTAVLNGYYYALVQLGYDGNHNIISLKNTRGYQSTFGYDTNPQPRLSWAKDPLGNQTTFTYNANSTVITDPNGHTTTHTYAYSQLASVTDALGNTSYSNYDVNNILSSTKDKRGNTWSSSSHFTNNTSTSTSTDPLSHTSSSTYSADGKNKVVQSVDALGNVTANTYSTDGKDDLLTTSITGTGTAPFKATSMVGGYTNGLPTTFTDALNHSSSVGYDSYGNVSTATDANSNSATAVSNVLGWKMSSTDANNHTTLYTHDNWGRVVTVTAPDNTQTTTTYDPDGNVLTVTDANHHSVTNVYDADDRLTQTTNGRGDVVKYAYDGTDPLTGASQKGLLSTKTDGNGHVTAYSYTARNEPAATFYADNTRESVTYDANGNTLTRTKADGKVIHYVYDAANRLTDITYPVIPAVHFDYDADGRKTHMHDSTGDTYWTFTTDGVHLSSTVTPFNGYTMTLNAAYDADGRRTVSTLVGQGSWTSTYDNGGRLHTLQSSADGTTTYGYDGPGGRGTKDASGQTQYGLLSGMTKGNGETETYTYDACNEMLSKSFFWVGGTYRNGLVYTYDPAGNVQTCNQGFYALSYGYDGADQLVSETNIGGNATPNYGYSYDNNGNRLTMTTNGAQSQGFTYDGHDKLTSGTAGAETDGHDLNGNETSISISGSSYGFTYDDEDRLVTATVPGKPTNTYTYNGLGLRVGKTDSTGSYLYVCDGTSPGSPVLIDGHTLYTPGLSENHSGASSFYDFDRLGNLWTVDDTSKNQLEYEDFTGFGGILAQAGSSTAFAFGGGNGCQTDADTGLVLMGHRYLDTRQGRFISQDPVGAGRNWYVYAGNNPVNKTDPSGLMPMDGPGSSPLGSPGYNNIAGGAAGWAENFMGEENFRGNYNKQVDQIHAEMMIYEASGWSLALGLLGDYLSGTGDDKRTYDNGSTQTKQLLNSKDGAEMLAQMKADGFKVNSTGGVNSGDAFKNTAGDGFMNGTEAQLGAFDWKILGRNGNTVQVMVTNDLTINSFFYHADNMNYSRSPIDSPYGPITVDEPMSTVSQKFIFTVHI